MQIYVPFVVDELNNILKKKRIDIHIISLRSGVKWNKKQVVLKVAAFLSLLRNEKQYEWF